MVAAGFESPHSGEEIKSLISKKNNRKNGKQGNDIRCIRRIDKQFR